MKAAAIVLAVLALAGCTAGPRPERDARRAYLGSAGEPSKVIAAELAFARMARDKGTWTAFRETATSDAVWPSPGWVNVQDSLKGQADPAQAIVWEPDRVWVSCDGSYALSTGPGTYPSGRKTRFATIWQRQNDGSLKWVLDQGFDLEAGYEKPDMIAALVAECAEGKRARREPARRGLAWQSGQSDDGTLAWDTRLAADCSRELIVKARRGTEMIEVFRRTSEKPAVPAGGQAPVCS